MTSLGAVLPLVGLGFVLATAGCRGDSGGKAKASDSDGGATNQRGTALAAFASCALTGIREFAADARTLELAATALVEKPVDTERELARTAFTRAFLTWQRLEPMQFGPAAVSSLPGGKDLRDQIYSWPLVSACAVDGEIVNRGWEASTFAMSLINRRGLAVIEYLLFAKGDESQCPPGSPILASGSWAAISSAERQKRRDAYAAAAAADLRIRADALAAAWAPGSGDFVAVLGSAGTGNRVFPTTQLALNVVSDAIFYLDRESKDRKLALPLGLRECATATCPNKLESPFADLSRAALEANLLGARRLLEGCAPGFEGLGFDDLVESAGAPDLARSLRAALRDTEASLQRLGGLELRAALADMPQAVRDVHAALKVVTTLLKTQFLSVLDLEIPKGLETDND